jgi:F-type H+-transporting ATPase subunit delta
MERLSVLYASALFDLAMQANVIDDFLDQAELLRDALKDEECVRVLVHPHISAAQKRDFFIKSFGKHIHEDLLGFLFLVADKNREAFLIPALTSLIEMIERYKGKVTAEVISAADFDEKQTTAMKGLLSKKLGKNVEIALKVDPSVIGGPYIYVDGYYIDWTVKKRLSDLTVHMKEGCSA